MSHYKATGLVTIRNIIQQKGQAVENDFLKVLSEKERCQYQTAVANQWLPLKDLEPKENFLTKTGDFLFPNEPNRIYNVGRLITQLQFTGIYRLFVKWPNPHMILKRYPKIWNTFYDDGSVDIIPLTPTSSTMIIRHPALPVVLQDYMTGMFTTILELTKARNPRLISKHFEPTLWSWSYSWE